jgi:hypothetical protein
VVLISKITGGLNSVYPNPIFQTWRLLFEQIRLHDVQAAEVLSLMAMLDGQQTPQDLFAETRRKRGQFQKRTRNVGRLLIGYAY